MDNYEEKYKSALKWMQSLYGGLHGATKEEAEKYFPELKESWDEKIRKEIIDFLGMPHPQFVGKRDHEKWIAWLEKQGEQNFDYEHADIPQKDFAPIEPKFKVGDWISGYYTNYKVTAINSKGYVVEDIDGNKINILFENEKLHHLWTIQDAKDGDVLVDVYGNIGIFEQYDDFDWSSYCSLGVNGGFQHFKVEHENEKTYPATKEQYDLLFQKIEEAGYKFDFEKKELKKMEVVSKESKDERIRKAIKSGKNTLKPN